MVPGKSKRFDKKTCLGHPIVLPTELGSLPLLKMGWEGGGNKEENSEQCGLASSLPQAQDNTQQQSHVLANTRSSLTRHLLHWHKHPSQPRLSGLWVVPWYLLA